MFLQMKGGAFIQIEIIELYIVKIQHKTKADFTIFKLYDSAEFDCSKHRLMYYMCFVPVLM